ncbi:MAG: hypothetical protein AB1656_21190 [Candidatus Omnitrophota bacterium]
MIRIDIRVILILTYAVFLLFSFALMSPIAATQEDSPIPPLLDSSSEKNSLADLLRNDLMKRFIQTQDEIQKDGSRARRPRPELGGARAGREPIDLSKYIGPAGDPQKTYDKLVEKGAIPPPSPSYPAYPSQPPESASDAIGDLLDNMPLDKKFEYVEDLIKRRKYETALTELEKILEKKLKGNDLINALILREKSLFHLKHYGIVEDDYFRLKAYYPKEKKIDALKEYLERQSGAAPLQESVMKNPQDPAAQQKLFDLYKHYGWLDFAEEFFAKTVQDTSEPTVISLSGVYYLKKDYEMLVELSRAAEKLHPQSAVLVYNEGVGLYSQGDPHSLDLAREAFLKARSMNLTPALRKNVEWYLGRLKTKPKEN